MWTLRSRRTGNNIFLSIGRGEDRLRMLIPSTVPGKPSLGTFSHEFKQPVLPITSAIAVAWIQAKAKGN